MLKPNMPRRFGRLPWQAKLRMKRMDRIWDARMVQLREAEARLAAARAASAAWIAEHGDPLDANPKCRARTGLLASEPSLDRGGWSAIAGPFPAASESLCRSGTPASRTSDAEGPELPHGQSDSPRSNGDGQ